MATKVRVFILLSYAVSCIGLCYWPDGTPSSTDFPCTSDANSTCCGQGYACMSNHLCASNPATFHPGDQNIQYIRGSCTDRSFTSANCPLFCIDPAVDIVNAGQDVYKCPQDSGDVYVCNTLTVEWDCNNGSDTLEFQGTPSAITTIGVTATSKATAASKATLTSASTSAAPNASSSSASDSPTASASAAPSSSSSSTMGAKIGGGVAGSIAGLSLLMVLGTVLYRSRAARKLRKSPANENDTKTDVSPPPYFDGRNDHETAAKEGTVPAEVETIERPQEVEGEQRYEAPGADTYHELPA